MNWIQLIFIVVRSLVRNQTDLADENLALRQQLAVPQRQSKRPKLKKRDRIFWVWLSKLLPTWRSILLIVQPDTVVRWHQQGFDHFVTSMAAGIATQPGRPLPGQNLHLLEQRTLTAHVDQYRRLSFLWACLTFFRC